MLVLGGLKLLERFRGQMNGRATPGIMLRGLLTEKDKEKARGLGVYVIVDKPCHVRELVTTVGEAIESQVLESLFL